MLRLRPSITETQKRRSLLQRVVILHGILLTFLLIIIARLIEIQIVKGSQYHDVAESQHFGGVRLPAKRGEVLALNSRTAETSILATNTTLDLVYVDPLVTDDPTFVAETLAKILVTEEFHTACSHGEATCPRELIPFFEAAFDPLRAVRSGSGTLFEPLAGRVQPIDPTTLKLPDITELRRLFARDIESRIAEKRVTFVPLKYGATKSQIVAVQALGEAGIAVDAEQKLISANPEEVAQGRIPTLARSLAGILQVDPSVLQDTLRSRPLRYVAVMRRLAPSLSLALKEMKLQSVKETADKRAQASTHKEAEEIQDPLRSIALLPEHWRFYPDATIASHVVGFLNATKEAQYGIERTFDPQLRGQEGLISSVRDERGGQILTAEQTIIAARDGDTVVLTIDPFIQKEVETTLDAAVKQVLADSGQAIVMDPYTGRILAMANAPLFDRNTYSGVYEKEPFILTPEQEKQLVAEVYHPITNVRVVKAYIPDLFTPEGRKHLTDKTRSALVELEKEYSIKDFARYYRYLGENTRIEVFPTQTPGVWLKFKNNIGVGAYLNRAIQEIYEPGSVMKPVTMASAIDQGEVTPDDRYDDKADVKVDEFTIKNALLIHYGNVTMTQCLEFSINTCMTSISEKLGKKLFSRMIERFGFGRVTGVELEDELPGEIRPWREWSNALLATAAFGQGISVTPLQMITAFSALANGGKLMRPTIIDHIVTADGEVRTTTSHIVDQVIKPETSDTITAMLVSSVEKGYAKTAKVKGYMIAGKTGTSQIAGPGGRYEQGTGSTIASFAGYAPVDHPKFVILVKLDRPKLKNLVHGAQAAAPVFKEIATFLLRYYGIPPDAQ
jgi:cell division protein FtsI/penicillin-binding protein 2